MLKLNVTRDNRPHYDITPEEAARLVDELLGGNHMFGVINRKADGTRRQYLINPHAYRSEIKGTGKPLMGPQNAHLRRVPDMRADTSGGQAHWRTLNLRTIRAISANGAVYHVAPDA